MKLWLISQDENNGYDTYDSAVVAAETLEEAQKTHPGGDADEWGRLYNAWARSPDAVTVKLLGTADASIGPGIVLASFNAG
jgi:hypothetical protein